MKPRSILVPIAMMIFATACFAQSSAGKINSAPILGVWRSQMEGLPAVTLTVTDEGGSLAGAVLFYLHRREPGQPVTVTPGVPEPLFNPTFDGKTLTFQVSHRRAHPPGSLGDPPVSFQLKLDPDGKTASSSGNEHDPNAPIYVFTRTDY